MKRIYGNLKMGWITVILFALAAGLYAGLIMLVPFLKETSFQDIGISYEWWVIFAVIIVVNCDKWWEAMLKCFVFFLISQPLIYLVEIVFGSLSFEQGLYYWKNWMIPTLLTIPGGFIAFFCKKQNLLGSIILGLGNSIQAIQAVAYFGRAFKNFPYHLLSALVCVASIIVMTIFIQKEKKNRVAAFITTAVVVLATVIFAKLSGLVFF